LVKQADGRITILAGSGIRPANVQKLVVQTGVQEIHGSAFAKTASAMAYRNPRLSMGADGSDEYALQVTDARKVRKMVGVLGRV